MSGPDLQLPTLHTGPSPLTLCSKGKFDQLFEILDATKKPKKRYKLHTRTRCLLYAATQGNLDAVRQLVEKYGHDPRFIYEPEGLSPLHCAATVGRLDIVEYLVAKGCCPKSESNKHFRCELPKKLKKPKAGSHMYATHFVDQSGMSYSSLPYAYNAKKYYDFVSKYSLQKKAAIEIRHGHLEIVKFLFSHGWNLSKDTDILPILKLLMSVGNVADLAYLLDHKHLSRPKIKASLYQTFCVPDIEMMKYLVQEDLLCISVKLIKDLAKKVSEEMCIYLVEHCTEDICSTTLDYMYTFILHRATLLDYACMSNIPLLGKAIAQCNLNSTDSAGRTPLHIACEHNNFELASFLVSRQCDQSLVDCNGCLALHVACRHNSLELVKILNLCDKSNKLGDTALHAACKNMNEDVIEYLVKEGCALNRVNNNNELPLHLVVRHGGSSRPSASLNLIAMLSESVDVNIPDNNGFTPVYRACELKNLDILEFLTRERKCRLDIQSKQGKLPLNSLVGYSPESKVVQAIIDVLGYNEFEVDKEDGEQNTLLHCACLANSLDLVRYLVIEKKCDVTKVNKMGNLPLHIACKSSSIEMVKLVSSGLKRDNFALINHAKETALHKACAKGDKEIARYLVQNGCNPVDEPELFTDLNIGLACADKSDFHLLLKLATKDNVNVTNYYDSVSPLLKACKNNNIEAVKLFTDVLECNLGHTNVLEYNLGATRDLPLHVACTKSIEMVKLVIRDVDINAVGFNGNTPLHIACMNNKAGIVKLLVEKYNCDQFVLNEEREYPLHLACEQSLETVKMLSIDSTHLMGVSYAGLTPLHIACKFDKLDIVQYLMTEFELYVSSVVAQTSLHPLDLACRTGNVELVRYLVENGGNTFKELTSGNTALHIACSCDSLEIVQFLIDNGHDTLITNSRKELPLHIASKKSLDLVKLTSYKCTVKELEAKTVDGATPLHLASSHGLLDVVKYLIETMNCSPLTLGDYDNNALAYACGLSQRYYMSTMHHPAVASYLVEHGCQPSEKSWLAGGENTSPMMEAIKHRNLRLFEALVKSEVSINCQDEHGNTPLILLCNKANDTMKGRIDWSENKSNIISFVTEAIQHLVSDRNCDQCIQNSKKELALHLACESGFFEIVKDLNCCISNKNDDGDTALHIACRTNNLQIFEHILKSRHESVLNFNDLNNESQSFLHLAVINNNERMVELLLTETNDIFSTCKDIKGLAPVHYASSESILKMLIAHESQNRDLLDSSGNSPLHTFILSQKESLIIFLLSIDASVNTKNIDGNTPLHLACNVKPLTDAMIKWRRRKNFNEPTVQSLLSHEVSLTVQNNAGDTPLHIACRSRDVRLVNLLLKAEHTFDFTIQNELGDTPFHIACATACFPIVDALLNTSNCDEVLAIKNAHGNIPFHVALELFQESQRGKVKKSRDSLRFFATNCTDINIQNAHGETLLHLACKVINQYSVHLLEFFVESNADLERVDEHGQLPLHVAASRSLKMIKVCCKQNLINQQDEDGNTPLHIACTHSKHDIASFLLNDMKCNSLIKNGKGQIPLHCACLKSSNDIIALLVQLSEPSINYQDNDGITPIHLLCKNLNQKGIIKLSESNARFDFGVQNNLGEAPLHIVCSNSTASLELVKCVVKCDPTLMLKDDPCDTALHIACRNHSDKVIEYLIENGHHPALQIRNAHGELPIHIICSKKDSLSSIKLIFKYFQSFNQRNNNGDTPLHIALRNKLHSEIVYYLIEEAKCNIALTNDEGDLPLHIACRTRVLMKYGLGLLTSEQTNVTALHECGFISLSDDEEDLSPPDFPLYTVCRTRMLKDELQLLASEETVNIKNMKKNTALHECCYNRWLSVLPFLLQLGANLDVANAEGRYPMHIACRFLSLKVVELFEPHGLTVKSNDGNTVLHEACLNDTGNAPEIVDYLLTYKPELDYSAVNSDGDLAMHIACRNHDLQFDIEDIVMQLLEHCDINLTNKSGNALLHELIGNKHSSNLILDLLNHPKYTCNLQIVNNLGETILHLVCKYNCRSVVSFLLNTRLSEVQNFINLESKECQTPIVLTTDHEIMQLLLDNGARAESLYRMHNDFFHEYGLDSPPETPVSFLVIGDPRAGKTTLVSSLKKEKEGSKSETFARTAGIVPNDFKSEEYGQVIMYDFAGQPEYYASHDAIIHAVIKKSPPIVLLVVDLTFEIDRSAKTISYWSSFVKNRLLSLTDRAHLYIICSHADIVKENGDDPEVKARDILRAVENSLNEIEVFDFNKMLTMDCTDPQSEELNKLRKYFANSTRQLRKKAVINFESHCISAFLKQTFAGEKVILIEKLRFAASKAASSTLLPKNPDLLKKICQDLNDTGLIMFLENTKVPHCSWLVLDKDALLADVSGKLFAPSSFPEYVGVYGSYTGVVGFAELREIFPQYDPNMLFGFLCQMEYCQEIIDDDVKHILHMKKPILPGKYYFFPNAVRVERPLDAWKHEQGYQFGWIMECDTGHHFTPYFIQILLLRLIFGKTEISRLSIPRTALNIHSKSIVWKSGLVWPNSKGIDTVVDVVDQSKVLILIHCKDGIKGKINCLQHRSSLLSMIRTIKQEICPAVSVKEYFIDPGKIYYPLQSTYRENLIPSDELMTAISQGGDFVYSKCGNRIELDDILFFDPYCKLCDILSDAIQNPEHSQHKPSHSILSALSDHFSDYFDIFVKFVCPTGLDLKEINQLTSPAEKYFKLLTLWLNRKSNTFQTLKEEFNKITVFDVNSRLPACNSHCSCSTQIKEIFYQEQDFQSYVSRLPSCTHPFLNNQLDWDNHGVQKDLNVIADKMINWEEKLSTHLDLTEVDIHDIKAKNRDKPALQRRDVLMTWKSKQAGHHQCAEALCEVLKKRDDFSSRDEPVT